MLPFSSMAFTQNDFFNLRVSLIFQEKDVADTQKRRC
jgi:hypothetical protein